MKIIECDEFGCSNPSWAKGKCKMHSIQEYHFNQRKSSLSRKSGLKKKGVSKLQGEKRSAQNEADNKLYEEIWSERKHVCVSCGKNLGSELKRTYMEHCLEKSIYKSLRHCKGNIFIVCVDCHSAKTMGHPTEKYKKIIEKTRELYEKGNIKC